MEHSGESLNLARLFASNPYHPVEGGSSCDVCLFVIDEVGSTMDCAASIIKGDIDFGGPIHLESPIPLRYRGNEFRDALPLVVQIILARKQNSGRGRRGNKWVSEFDEGIYTSVIFDFGERRPEISGLSLAMGLAISNCLAEIGVQALVKWPNDILVELNEGQSDRYSVSHWDRVQESKRSQFLEVREGRIFAKVAGVLIETTSTMDGGLGVVCGVGLNIRNTPDINQVGGVGLEHMMGRVPNYVELVHRVIFHLVSTSALFFAKGFGAIRDEWVMRSLLQGQTVTAFRGEELVEGVVKGVDDFGGLVLGNSRGDITIYSGEVSLVRVKNDV